MPSRLAMRAHQLRRARLVLVAVLASGCAQQGSASADLEPQSAVQPDPGPRCAEVPEEEGLLVVVDDPSCPWVLSRQELTLHLRHLGLQGDPPVMSVRGAMPAACVDRSCSFEVHETPLGPAVLAVVPSGFSEMPEGVHLGWVAQEQLLVFIDLWDGAGPASVNESTPVGPMFSLAPHDCSGALGLFAVPRLEVDVGVEPPHELVEREGIYRPSPSGWEREEADRSGCVLLDVALP